MNRVISSVRVPGRTSKTVGYVNVLFARLVSLTTDTVIPAGLRLTNERRLNKNAGRNAAVRVEILKTREGEKVVVQAYTEGVVIGMLLGLCISQHLPTDRKFRLVWSLLISVGVFSFAAYQIGSMTHLWSR